MNSITSTAIGTLVQNEEFEDWWESQPVSIPLFDDKPLTITLMGLTPAEDLAFLPEADRALAHFLSKVAADRLAMSSPVYQNCMDFLNAVGYDEMDEPLWAIKEPREIWPFVDPREIRVSRRHRRDQDIYLVVECECEWEQEHSLQLVFRQGKQLTRVSAQDGHLTEADAYDTPDAEDELLSSFRD